MCFLKVKADEEGVELSLRPVYIYVLYILSNTRVYVQYNSAVRYKLHTVEYSILTSRKSTRKRRVYP
jgi:hypothetical protein